jgi:hypothetical protein
MSARWFRAMLFAVKLHGEIRGGAIEVENIGSDRMLTPKGKIVHLRPAKMKPQSLLGSRRVTAQGARACGLQLCAIEFCHGYSLP